MEANEKIVDFLIIGAAKSGTTSLYAHLRKHPQIYLPLEKEVCFFSNNEKYNQGIEWYKNEYFPESKTKNKVIGEATPAYMLYGYVPERIYRHTPNAKLIAILRNPIYRAHSHYFFSKRLHVENREFSEALDYLIARKNIPDEDIKNENREYLMFGEYAKILSRYLEYFPKNQIKIVFFEDLKDNPFKVMHDLFEFLGVDSDFKSEEFNKRHNVSGKARFKSILKFQNWLKNNKTVKNLIFKVFPADFVGGIDQWVTRKGNLKKIEYSGPSEAEIETLVNYYKDDVDLLRKEFDLIAPWPEFSKE